MKWATFLLIILFGLSLNGCSGDKEDKTLNFSESDVQMKFILNTEDEGTLAQWTMLYTGRSICWFDAATAEVKFQDTPESSSMIALTLKSTDHIDFYLGDEFLFSAKIRSGANSDFYNDIVLYYDLAQNKYFIRDGYPPLDDEGNENLVAQQERDENWKKIKNGYQKLIDQLGKEGRMK